MIDWTDKDCPITSCKTFTVRDALWLNQFNRLATAEEANEAIKRNLVGVFITISSIIRHLSLDRPTITSAFRNEEYNRLIGGAKRSAHMRGRAVDMVFESHDAEDIRQIFRPLLDAFYIRMENNPGAPWIHIDTVVIMPGMQRYFLP